MDKPLEDGLTHSAKLSYANHLFSLFSVECLSWTSWTNVALFPPDSCASLCTDLHQWKLPAEISDLKSPDPCASFSCDYNLQKVPCVCLRHVCVWVDWLLTSTKQRWACSTTSCAHENIPCEPLWDTAMQLQCFAPTWLGIKSVYMGKCLIWCLLKEFSQRFQDVFFFTEKEIKLFSTPFPKDTEEMEESLPLEVIESWCV